MLQEKDLIKLQSEHGNSFTPISSVIFDLIADLRITRLLLQQIRAAGGASDSTFGYAMDCVDEYLAKTEATY